ncbi:MAG: type II secretion system F family protein [Lachnospiraceae bacterium]
MVYIILLAAFIILAVAASRSNVQEEGTGVFDLEHLFDRMAAVVYQCIPKHPVKNTPVVRNLVQLNPRGTAGWLKRSYDIGRIKLLLLVIFAGDVIALLLWISDGEEGAIVDGSYILRTEQGEGSREILLTAKRESGEELETSLVVQECRYEEEELDRLYAEMLENVYQKALAGNTSWDCVTEDLCFVEHMEGYPFTLSWSSDNYAFVTGSGKVAKWEDVVERKEQSAIVSIRLQARYYDFVREEVFYAKVCPVQEKGTFADEAAIALREAEGTDPYGSRVFLPEKIGGETVTWYEKKDDRSRNIFLMSLLGAALVWILKGRELQKQVQDRNSRMETEYPAIISKLTLYLGAGMNLKSAWRKTAMEGKENPIYQEMLLTCREIDSGISEAEAYERFGKRIRQQRYIRLTTLLVQNLRKGNAALLLQLRQESFLALEERTATVKKTGEEMGTKLLFPMLLMMGMVMVLIMVPAFLSF